MKMRILFLFVLSCLSLGQLTATPTTIIIRAKAKDAKFIGSSLGGALVIIRNATNGQILAEGITRGSTGNTSSIMSEPHDRYTQLSDDNTAKFEAILDLDAPTLLSITVHAPINQR